LWTYELGLLYYTLEDFKNAVVFFNKAAEKGYPQKSDFAEIWATLTFTPGRWTRVNKMLMDLVNKRPGDKEMLRDMAEVFYKIKCITSHWAFVRN